MLHCALLQRLRHQRLGRGRLGLMIISFQGFYWGGPFGPCPGRTCQIHFWASFGFSFPHKTSSDPIQN